MKSLEKPFYKIRNTLELPPEPELASVLMSAKGVGLKVVIAPNDAKAGEYFSSLQSFFENREKPSGVGAAEHKNPSIYNNQTVLLNYPSRDVLPFELANSSSSVLFDRTLSKYQLLNRSDANKIILVTSIPALFEKIESRKVFNSSIKNYSKLSAISKSDLIADLISLSYSRKLEVEEVGYFADHGSVVDVFSPLSSCPYRFEFFGGKLVSIRIFDPADQRSIAELDECTLALAGEYKSLGSNYLELYRGLLPTLDVSSQQIRLHEERLNQDLDWPGAYLLRSRLDVVNSNILDYADGDRAIFFLGDYEYESWVNSWSSEIESRARIQLSEETYINQVDQVFFSSSTVLDSLGAEAKVPRTENSIGDGEFQISRVMPELLVSKDFTGKSFQARAIDVVNRFSLGISGVSAKLKKDTYKRVILTFSTLERAESIQSVLSNVDIEARLFSDSLVSILDRKDEISQGVFLIVSSIARGFILEEDGLILISEKDLLGVKPEGRRHRKYPYRKANFREKLSNLRQLAPGDFIVHEMYGVGVFNGLKSLVHGSEAGEYLELVYSNTDKLYVPVHDFLRVGKYSGPEGRPPVLTKLGAGQWEVQKKKVRDTLLELTSQLLKTVAIRSISKGYSFGPRTDDDRLFADQFEYDETPDQLKAIEAVLDDMSSEKPMDRLVCGDVGFGKTEVAMRAAFKAVSGSKQVAILVPTTILADQHGRTFQTRFSGVPVRIEVLSRFYTPKRNTEVVQKLSTGDVDIVIGTHRLLQADVNFKDLGLVIIDEEHRFGVAQKEKLKKLRAEVDVLSLSATPIPRTLQMALFGTRDLSIIETAPVSRQVIQTIVRDFDEHAFRDAILREVARGGQVYIVHHYISELESIRELIISLVPELRMGVVHGRIKKSELEVIMHDFYSGKIQLLLATHIIESGLDVANANTMIIMDPENFGLAQLYQLRGRVGRSSIKAYAYLLYKNKANLTSDALKRLDAMSAIDELGIGFKLALQDMEIRGAGTLLGKDQSGHVQILGYEMYLKILEEAVRIEKSRRNGKVAENINLDTVDPELKLGIYPTIPKEYIFETEERVVLYQRACYLNTKEDGENYLDDLQDRYGRYPAELIDLVHFMIVKSALRDMGSYKAVLSGEYVTLYFKDEKELLAVFDKFPSDVRAKRELLRVRLHQPDFQLKRFLNGLLSATYFLGELGLGMEASPAMLSPSMVD